MLCFATLNHCNQRYLYLNQQNSFTNIFFLPIISYIKAKDERKKICKFSLNFQNIYQSMNIILLQKYPALDIHRVECDNSLSKTMINTTCGVKSYSRVNKVMNLNMFIFRKLNSTELKV